MTCNRYFEAPCISFCNNDSVPHSNRDKVLENRSVIGSPNRNFQELWNPCHYVKCIGNPNIVTYQSIYFTERKTNFLESWRWMTIYKGQWNGKIRWQYKANNRELLCSLMTIEARTHSECTQCRVSLCDWKGEFEKYQGREIAAKCRMIISADNIMSICIIGMFCFPNLLETFRFCEFLLLFHSEYGTCRCVSALLFSRRLINCDI
jgi:hypothetical protein